MKILQALIVVSIFSFGNLAFAQSYNAKETKEFGLIDGDKNEVITIREMIAYYDDKTTKEDEATEAKKMFYGLDSNENSIVTLDEFVKGVDWNLAYEFVEYWDKKDGVIAENTSPEKDIETKQLTDKFNTLDTDTNTMLSMAEVINFYEGLKNETTGEPLNGELNFYSHDFNNDGEIALEEFLKKADLNLGLQRLKDSEKLKTASIKKNPSEIYINERIKLFSSVDTDGNYKITLLELQNYYQGKINAIGNPVNAKLRYYGLDTNEDDSIELAEFVEKIDFKYADKRMKENREEY